MSIFKKRIRILSALAAGLVLLLNLLAVSPSLHEWLHADATDGQHQCAVTLISHGMVDAPVGDALLAAALTVVDDFPAFEQSVFVSVVKNLPSGRAPPSSFVRS